MRTNSAIIVGGIHHNTLGVIRSLARTSFKDFFLILIGNSHDFISCSKYIKKKNIIKIDSESNLLETLLRIGPSFISKPTIICSSDPSIAIIDQNLNVLSKFYLLPNAFNKQGEINRLMDKSVQCAIAEKSGFRIPKTQTISKLSELEKWNLFPCIIKPIESIMGSKNDIKVYYNKSDLLSDIQALETFNFQIQQFIEKKIEFQLIGCSMHHGKELIIPGYTNIIRQPPNTNTGYLLYKQLEDFCSQSLKNSIHSFMDAIGYEGLFSLEFIRDKMGNDYFLEINMRNDGNAFCVTKAGINLPQIFLSYTKGISTHINQRLKHSVYFMPELEDLVLAKKLHINFSHWIRDFINTKAHAVYSIKDPLPFLYKLFFFLQGFVKEHFFKTRHI